MIEIDLETVRLTIGGKAYRLVPEEEPPESDEERDHWQKMERHSAQVSRVEQAREICAEKKEEDK